jgi:hypothetical protein
VGEYFLDFNNNQHLDAADHVFKGIVCTSNAANATCSSTPWPISKKQIVIMSTSSAQITVPTVTGTGASVSGGAITLAHGQPFTVSINIQDLNGTLNSTTHLLENGNPIAAGSSIAVGVGVAASSPTLSGTLTAIEGCSDNIGGDTYVISGTAPTTAQTGGSITVTVISEATKTISSATFPVTTT